MPEMRKDIDDRFLENRLDTRPNRTALFDIPFPRDI